MFTFDTDGAIASGASIVDGRIYSGGAAAYLWTKADNKLHALALPLRINRNGTSSKLRPMAPPARFAHPVG